jgi:enhancing lycopene biosynthesis protein 2
MSHNIAVILSGCGYLDGAEIRESVLSLLALDRQGARVKMFAPDEFQFHTVDHLNSDTIQDGQRNTMIEAARIARGNIQPLDELQPEQFEALILPGGYGVAKNLSNLAFEGASAKLHPKFAEVLESFYQAKKPIGAICISPAVICLGLGKYGIEVTIGEDPGTAQVIESLGGKHINCKVDEIHTDQQHRIVSTPAYMDANASISAVSTGIEKCIAKVLEMLK